MRSDEDSPLAREPSSCVRCGSGEEPQGPSLAVETVGASRPLLDVQPSIHDAGPVKAGLAQLIRELSRGQLMCKL